MADLPVIIGAEKFLQLCTESVWATEPGSPTYYDIPVNDYTVRFKPKRRNGKARVGTYQQSYGTNPSGHPVGNIVTPLYGWHSGAMSTSIAQFMMEWGALDQEVKFPRSKCAKWLDLSHLDDKKHLGLRVNTFTLAGSDAGIVLTLELIGKTETILTGQVTTPPTTRHKVAEFLFEDTVFSLAGTPVNISSFQWQIQRNLDVIYENSPTPLSCPKTQFNETLTVTLLKGDTTYDTLRDALGMAEMTGALTLKGLHDGTGGAGTFSQVAVAFARLSLIDSDESGGVSALMNPLSFAVLKPDTSANGSVMTWSEV